MYLVKKVIDGSLWYFYGFEIQDRCILLTDDIEAAYHFHDEHIAFLFSALLYSSQSEFSIECVPGLC